MVHIFRTYFHATVQAMAYDNPIPGFDTYNTNNLRLWRACPSKDWVGSIWEFTKDAPITLADLPVK